MWEALETLPAARGWPRGCGKCAEGLEAGPRVEPGACSEMDFPVGQPVGRRLRKPLPAPGEAEIVPQGSKVTEGERGRGAHRGGETEPREGQRGVGFPTGRTLGSSAYLRRGHWEGFSHVLKSEA